MNKDKPYEPSDDSAAMAAEHRQINRQNFDWAAISAQRTSVVLFESFLFSLPAGSNYIAAASARAASQRQGEMAWLSKGLTTPWQLGPGGRSAAGTITSNTSNRAGQILASQWTLSASVCPTTDGKTCISIIARPPNSPLVDLVTVTSVGAPVAGATVTVSGQSTNTVFTNANGVAVITHLPCYAPGSQVPKVGQTRVPVRTPVPCAATASMAGYQPYSFTLP